MLTSVVAYPACLPRQATPLTLLLLISGSSPLLLLPMTVLTGFDRVRRHRCANFTRSVFAANGISIHKENFMQSGPAAPSRHLPDRHPAAPDRWQRPIGQRGFDADSPSCWSASRRRGRRWRHRAIVGGKARAGVETLSLPSIFSCVTVQRLVMLTPLAIVQVLQVGLLKGATMISRPWFTPWSETPG